MGPIVRRAVSCRLTQFLAQRFPLLQQVFERAVCVLFFFDQAVEFFPIAPVFLRQRFAEF